MSAWPEAVYIIQEMRKTLISIDSIKELTNRHTILDKIVIDQDAIFPSGYIGQDFSEESLWLITDENPLITKDYTLSVIDDRGIAPGGGIQPAHKTSTDEYLNNSIWLITREKG